MTESRCSTSVAAICSLPADELRNRIAELRRDLLPKARRSERLPDDAGLAIEFDARREIAEQLEALVEFERQCCSGLVWAIETRPDTLRLTVAGVPPDSAFFRALGIEGS